MNGTPSFGTLMAMAGVYSALQVVAVMFVVFFPIVVLAVMARRHLDIEFSDSEGGD